MIQKIKYLQNHIRLLDETISELADLTRQAEAMREKLKAELAMNAVNRRSGSSGLCGTNISASMLQIINEMRAELISEGIDPDDSYRDYAMRNYGLV